MTKSGSYIYWGDAANYHEWVFRTELRARAAGTDPVKYADTMSRIVDGLRGEAFIAAKDIGVDRLWQPGGEEEIADYEGSEHTEFVEDAGEEEEDSEDEEFAIDEGSEEGSVEGSDSEDDYSSDDISESEDGELDSDESEGKDWSDLEREAAEDDEMSDDDRRGPSRPKHKSKHR